MCGYAWLSRQMNDHLTQYVPETFPRARSELHGHHSLTKMQPAIVAGLTSDEAW